VDAIRRVTVVAWVVGVLGVALMATSLVSLRAGYKLVTVRGESMVPTYDIGDPVLFERIGAQDVRRGDVVLYAAPERYHGKNVVQRVVGVGGVGAERAAAAVGAHAVVAAAPVRSWG